MQGSEFLYFLTDNNNQFYSIANGGLKLSAKPVPLEFSPDGWQEVSIQNIRDKNTFSVDRTISSPYTFVEDGADILKHIFYKYGVNAEVNLIICHQQLYCSGGEYGFWYKLLTKLDVDLSTYNHDGFKVTCNLLEGGFPKYFKANKNTTYEIPLDDLAVNVKMDGIVLHSQSTFITTNDGVSATVFASTGPNTANVLYALTYYNTVTENTGTNLVYNNVLGEAIPFDLSSSNKNFIDATGDVELHVNIKDYPLSFSTNMHDLNILNTSYAKLYIKNQSGAIIRTLYEKESDVPFSENVLINDSFVINLVAGDKLFFLLEVYVRKSEFDTSQNYSVVVFTGESDQTYDSRARKETTYIKALRPLDLFARLIDKVTDGYYEVDSTLLDLEKHKVWTCGNGIRGLSDSFIKISLSDFFGFWDTYKDAGMTVKDGKVILERKVDLINNSDIKALGQISSLKVTPATDLMFNTLKIGYPDKQQEGTNGKQSFNNTFEWSLGATRVVKSLDKTCKVITDCYSAELTRVTFDGKDTTDSRQDSDPYVLHIESTTRPAVGDIPEHFRLDRSLNIGTTGLLEPDTVFNLALTPKRCMLNNGGYFRSVLDLMDTSIFKFTTSSKNNAVVCDGLIEKEDIPVGLIGTRYFKPYYFDFELIADNDLLDLLDENPLKVFSFQDVNNVTYKGIAEKVGIEPNYNKNQTYKLLCTSDTDLKPLIDYYGG